MNTVNLNMDAFASGQIGSKLWLCNELEKLTVGSNPMSIWLFGGWYGVLPVLLLSREKLSIKEITNFEIDETTHHIFMKSLDFWHWKGLKINTHNVDVNQLKPEEAHKYCESKPNLYINTSVEHMTELDWWKNIPKGALTVLQSCNMEHVEHVRKHDSITQFQDEFIFSNLLYSGELSFDYNNENSFKRFMLIGEK